MRIGYVLNRYPAVSNTFILREITALGRLGVQVHPFSIRCAREADLLAEIDREEARRTFSILPPDMPRVLAAHLRALATRPSRYLATLGLALGLRPPGARGALWQLFYFGEAILVWDECRRRGVRHLHAHFGNVACDVALLASHFGDGHGGRWSFSFTVHGYTEFYELARNRLAEKARRAAMVVCISQFARSQVMGLLPQAAWDKTVIVHCGIEPEAFAAPRRNGGGAAPLRVLCVGRLVPVKGHGVLLEAVAELVAEGRDIETTLVGEGPDRSEVEGAIARLGLHDRVRLAGAIGQDAIGGFYADADVFCLASFAEGLPVVLMEAMAAELPVISTSIMGIPELVDDEESGLLVMPADPAALADSLRRLADDPALRARLGSAARAKVEAEFHVDRSAEQLRGLFAGMPGSDDAALEPLAVGGAAR